MSPEAAKLLTTTYILAGLNIDAQVVRRAFSKVLQAMRESSTYMAILEEGAIAHTQDLILKIGQKHLGDPNEKQLAKLKAIQDLERLDRIAEKVFTAKSWDGLLRVQ